ncbi:MAG: hypothetical protein AABY07_05205 [Nanoarchaeota archaeon]
MKKSVIFVIIIAIVVVVFGFFLVKNLRYEKIDQKSSEKLNFIKQGLRNLCSNEEDCISFCQNNRGICEEYCKENENELCKIIFSGDTETNSERSQQENEEEENQNEEQCQGTRTKFDYAPTNLDKTKLMLPIGLMVDTHVTPVDHHYFQNFDNQEYDIEIYSPGDGYIIEIGGGHGENGNEYRMIIEHTCTISSIYIYISDLPDKIKSFAPVGQGHVNVRIPVAAGEFLGFYKTNLDYNLVDEEVTLNFIVPEHYVRESWKINVPDTYDYFNEPVRSKLIEKSVRTAEPISGKIDYDIDGKLVGNWFVEGTNGYAGSGQGGYWLGHLTLAYDYIDPGRIAISIGGYNGQNSGQFGVAGNAPNPKEIGLKNGLVKYELVQYDYITLSGTSWDRRSLVKDLTTKINSDVQGTVLVQMIEDRKIKFEAFPGKTASQVSGFTNNAKIYER